MRQERAEVPDLKQFLNNRKDEILAQINCVALGTIQAFYSASQTADISINYKRVIAGDTPIAKDYPLLINCPVVVLNGGGAYISFPIAQGDTCLVLFCDRDIDNWFETGQVMVPNSSRAHDLSDGIALVGIKSKLNPLTYDGSNLKLFMGSGYITIGPDGKITINSPDDVDVVAGGNVTIQGTVVDINP